MVRSKQDPVSSTQRSAAAKSDKPRVAAAAATKKRKKPKWRPGTVALRQIRKYQKTGEMLVPKACFERLVREIGQDYKTDLRFQGTALDALHEAAETYLVEILRIGGRLAIHSGRVTLFKKDVTAAKNMYTNIRGGT